jgi:hypothetical protein
MTFKEKDRVTIVSEIMQDIAHKSGYHLFERILREKEVGYIRNMDLDKSKERMENLWWVKFHVAAIRLEEKYLVKEEEA